MDKAEDFKGYSRVLHRLFKDVTITPHSSESEEEAEDYVALPRSDSLHLITGTDVTLPSCLNGSLGSRETDRRMNRSRRLCSSSSGAILEEMQKVYEQLQSERQKQLQWEKELQEREMKLKQQEDALQKVVGLEEMLHSQMLTAEEKHNHKILHLQNLLREKTKENKRLKTNFDTLKDLNDNMKKQLNELSEQNKGLERRSRRVQARLENLQRKYELGFALRGCQKVNVQSLENVIPPQKDKTKISNVIPSSKLLSLLMDWIVDKQTSSSQTHRGLKDVGHCFPPEISHNDRCLKVLPLLADQLSHTPLSESVLVRSLLRFIHAVLRQVDNSAQHVALSATLRRIGEEVSRPRSHLLSEDPEGVNEGSEKRTLYRCSCPETRILSVLIILRTVTQAEVLEPALAALRSDLSHEARRGLLLQFGGVSELMSVLKSGRTPAPVTDALLQLAQDSSYLKSFLEACSCHEFFHAASQVLRSRHLELSLLEKLCIILQKLSTIRKNQRLFESSRLRQRLEELQRSSGPSHTFLCLNLTSILHNLSQPLTQRRAP
uniref:Coiled-coil domain-containing protein 138 n=1 Tax=Knipowitschia caucasica TaxID=637954 RepID=A0AAV2K428_KNICA